ncbi:unnamed protein product, partial [Closterium sp. Naga37s-1]
DLSLAAHGSKLKPIRTRWEGRGGVSSMVAGGAVLQVCKGGGGGCQGVGRPQLAWC